MRLSRSALAVATNIGAAFTVRLTCCILGSALTGSRTYTITVRTVYVTVGIIIQAVVANFLSNSRAIARTGAVIFFRITHAVAANRGRTVYPAVGAVLLTFTDSITATVAGPAIRTRGVFFIGMTDSVAASFEAAPAGAASCSADTVTWTGGAIFTGIADTVAAE